MRTTIVTICILNAVALAQSPDFESPHYLSRVLVQFQPATNQAARQSAHQEAGTLQILEEYSAFEGMQMVLSLAFP